MQRMLSLKKEIRVWLVVFMICLVLSGITAFAIETELRWLLSWWSFRQLKIYEWLRKIYNAVRITNNNYPFIAYGYDWLAFAHIVIAIVFIGPLRDPVKNIWVIQFGCIACMLIFPLAFIAGGIRQIPVPWRLIDCSFGVVGIVPLWICYKKTRLLEKESARGLGI